MQNIIIDKEFKNLLPALDKSVYAALEENLLQNGCRDSLVLWNGILIDGHNRYNICTEHSIPFNTVDKEFESRDEVLIWIITTQISRRNLTPEQLGYYRGKHYNVEKKSKWLNNRYMQKSTNGQNDRSYNINENTAKKLGSQYNVGEKTIRRDAKFAAAIDAIGDTSPDAKSKILAGEAKINKCELEELSEMSAEEIASAATMIDNGTYEKIKSAGSKIPEHGSPIDIIIAGINDLSVNFRHGLQGIAKNGDTLKLKTAMRSYIDRLESFYGQI